MAKAQSALAGVLIKQGQLDEPRSLYSLAVEHQGAACRMAPAERQFGDQLSSYYMRLIDVTYRLRDHAATAETARSLAQFRPEVARDAYDAARALALCASLAKKDSRLEEVARQTLADVYADQAVHCLQEAVHRGFHDAARLKTERNFGGLRSRPDFGKLVTTLEER
jgi:hypothetical protein